MDINEIWRHAQCNECLADDYASVKTICVLVRNNKRCALGGSTAVLLDDLLLESQEKAYHCRRKSLARSIVCSEAGHIVFPELSFRGTTSQ